MSEIEQSTATEPQLHKEQSIDSVVGSILAPRIEIPGLVIEHLDHSSESMNAAIDELLEEADRRLQYGGPEDIYHEFELPHDKRVVFEIYKDEEASVNGRKEVESIELKFRDANGTGFEYWLSEAGIVLLFGKPDGSEEVQDLFNNYQGGERRWQDWLDEDMQEHVASAVAAMRAMMDRATMGYPTPLWHKN
jgi:hypothetical protein